MPPPAPSDQARKAIKSAFNQLQATITPGHSRNFATTTLEDVKEELLKIENELAARQLLRNTRRLAPLLQGLEHYAKVMDILCNGTPFLPWAWAPITLILRIASEHLEAFEHIMKGYRRIAECLGRFSILDNAFKYNHGFQQTLAVFYADILDFHKHAYQFVRRSGWKLLFVTSWHRFQRRFDHIFENLKKHEDLIDKEANAYNVVEDKQMRLEIRAWREECAEQLERTDKDQSMKQYSSIISWLKVDESDQLSIFQALLEESTKYPGTCDWVIQHRTVRSLLQRKPDVPILWIQGAAGTGKSVLSSNIMNYMDHSGQLVLSHFCNYAYPQSTKYECILRSLLSQLIRKDGDLAAHVYEGYVLGKKAPSIPILERLLHLLLSSISKEPQQTSYIWIIFDGLDECDQLTQNKVLSLITHVTSKAASSNEVICKALISSRFSASTSSKLRKTQAISLAEEKDQMGKSIRLYAAQRLNAIYSKFQQMNLSGDDINGIEDTITKKADGMFLYARLVLDYLSSNIFFNGEEIKDSVYELPKELSEFYSKIVTQILVRLNRRSVDRLKCALGWIAFSKRPLKKMEFLSANAFSSGEADVRHVAPQYMLDICTALIEERPDSRLSFIHVSVKEFLQSSSSNLVLIERDCLLQHGIAAIRCLLAGMEAFPDAVPRHNEKVLVEVVKGLHSFHIYSKEYWTDYLLSLAMSREEDDSTSRSLLDWAFELAKKLDQYQNSDSEPTTYVDERISTLLNPLLRSVVNECLKARSERELKLQLQQLEAKGKAVANAGVPAVPTASEGVSLLLKRYQATIQYLLRQTDFPGITAAEFESFKRQSRASAFTCRVKGCPQATDGFESQKKCHEHELLHVRRPECTYPGCQYPPFISSAALKRHINNSHNPTPQRRAIRKVKNMHPGSLHYANRRMPKPADEKDGDTSAIPSCREPKESTSKRNTASTNDPTVPKLDRTTTDIYIDEMMQGQGVSPSDLEYLTVDQILESMQQQDQTQNAYDVQQQTQAVEMAQQRQMGDSSVVGPRIFRTPDTLTTCPPRNERSPLAADSVKPGMGADSPGTPNHDMTDILSLSFAHSQVDYAQPTATFSGGRQPPGSHSTSDHPGTGITTYQKPLLDDEDEREYDRLHPDTRNSDHTITSDSQDLGDRRLPTTSRAAAGNVPPFTPLWSPTGLTMSEAIPLAVQSVMDENSRSPKKPMLTPLTAHQIYPEAYGTSIPSMVPTSDANDKLTSSHLPTIERQADVRILNCRTTDDDLRIKALKARERKEAIFHKMKADGIMEHPGEVNTHTFFPHQRSSSNIVDSSLRGTETTVSAYPVSGSHNPRSVHSIDISRESSFPFDVRDTQGSSVYNTGNDVARGRYSGHDRPHHLPMTESLTSGEGIKAIQSGQDDQSYPTPVSKEKDPPLGKHMSILQGGKEPINPPIRDEMDLLTMSKEDGVTLPSLFYPNQHGDRPGAGLDSFMGDSLPPVSTVLYSELNDYRGLTEVEHAQMIMNSVGRSVIRN